GPARDVARGHDVRSRDATGIADDAVVDREAGPVEPARLWLYAHADDDHIGRDERVVAEPHAPYLAIVALDALDDHARAQVDAVVTMYGRNRGAELGPEPADHRLREHLEQRDVKATHAACRRDLGADEAGADHDDLRPRVEELAQRECVVERAQSE